MRKQALNSLYRRMTPPREPGQVYFQIPPPDNRLFELKLGDKELEQPLDFEEINRTDGPLRRIELDGLVIRPGGFPANLTELAAIIGSVGAALDPDAGDPPKDDAGFDAWLRKTRRITSFEPREGYDEIQVIFWRGKGK